MATATAPAANGTVTRKFTPGFQREVIALRSIEGKPVHSQFGGDQVQYFLTDGRKWYVDQVTRQRIDQLRIQPGELFEVVKTVTREGNRRIEQVEISYLKEPADSCNKPESAEYKTGRGAGNLNNSNPSTQQSVAPAAALPPRIPAKSAAIAAPMNGNGETSAEQLARCYRDAVDIARSAVDYAAGSGLVIAPAFCDIRALAATIAISEGGRR